MNVASLLSLEYPNGGRTHELESDEEMKPGQEFDLYGHRWKVVGAVRERGSRNTLKSAPPLPSVPLRRRDGTEVVVERCYRSTRGAIAIGAAEILPQPRGLELHPADLSLMVGVEASSRED